jgi:hypothetical protein
MVQRNFRCNIDGPGKEPKGQDHQGVSIISPPPPAPLLMKFFASIRRHLTKKQLHAKAAREACGKPVVRKEFEPRRRSMLITANQPFGEWGKGLPRPGHDARGRRPPRPPCDHPGDERKEL